MVAWSFVDQLTGSGRFSRPVLSFTSSSKAVQVLSLRPGVEKAIPYSPRYHGGAGAASSARIPSMTRISSKSPLPDYHRFTRLVSPFNDREFSFIKDVLGRLERRHRHGEPAQRLDYMKDSPDGFSEVDPSAGTGLSQETGSVSLMSGLLGSVHGARAGMISTT